MKKIYTTALSLLTIGAMAQNVGINTDGSVPNAFLHVKANAAADGIMIENVAANGDPTLKFTINGTDRITMGVDDSDADKWKLGTTAITTNTRLTIQTNGNIGINTTTPTYMFQMVNNGAVGAAPMADYTNTGSDGVALSGYNSGGANAYNGFEGITAGTYSGVMGLGITTGAGGDGVLGYTNDWQSIGVLGVRVNSGGADTGWGGLFYNDLGYTGGVYNASDERLKVDIEPIEGGITTVMSLNPVQYYYDTDTYPYAGFSDHLEFGFVAQEVQSVLPNIVKEKALDVGAASGRSASKEYNKQTESFLMIDYTRVIPILTLAIQEQQAQIEELKQQLEDLQNIVDEEVIERN